MGYPPAYIDLLESGPFPGRLDPWVEDAHYFEQIHSGIIHQLLHQTRRELLSRVRWLADLHHLRQPADG